MKYGTRVPRNVKESAQFDRENVNYIWENVILKELEALMSISFSKKIILSLRKER